MGQYLQKYLLILRASLSFIDCPKARLWTEILIWSGVIISRKSSKDRQRKRQRYKMVHKALHRKIAQHETAKPEIQAVLVLLEE